MAKKVVQDIVPNERRTIRRISLDSEVDSKPKTFKKKIARITEREDEREEKMEKDEDQEEVIEPAYVKKHKVKKGNGSYKYLISFIIILVSITIIGIALSLSYSKAVVTITQKVVNFNVDGTFTAKKSVVGINKIDEINYDVISVSDTAKQTISAIKGPLIQTKAKGTATIYNNYSSSTQILVAGTRLANPDGLIYRTVSTVSVPGKKINPGSITVSIIADKAGEDYNLKSSDTKNDFKLIGYKGTSKYSGFYAKAKTDLTGGFSGNKMTVDQVAKAKLIKDAQDALGEQLITKLKASVPEQYNLYNNAYTLDYAVSEPNMNGDNTAEITIKGTAYGAIFNSDLLIKYIAGKEISKFPSDSFILNGDKELVFKISNIKDFSAKNGTPVIFTLKGPISITGTFNEDSLKNDLKGIKLKDSNAVFARYPAISNAYALITPFWLRSFPDSIDKINLEYKH